MKNEEWTAKKEERRKKKANVEWKRKATTLQSAACVCAYAYAYAGMAVWINVKRAIDGV